jgi:putative SOS response-associated peptidase YedK
LQLAGYRARMVQALCVVLADGFADWTETPERHVGLYAPDGGRSEVELAVKRD